MKIENNYLTVNQIQEQYLKAKASVGICHDYSQAKILVSGEMALSLINHFSITKIDDKITNNFYTILLKRKNFVAEVLVLRLSLYRYLIITTDLKAVFRLLKKKRRKFPLTLISNVTSQYSIFSFHGDKANIFFRDIDYNYIFKTKNQNYTYYQLLCPKNEQAITLKHFLNLNFTAISLEVKNLFLYNNNVILNIKTIPKRYRLSTCAQLYPANLIKAKLKSLKVCKYELEGNFLITTKHKIYSYLRKKAGIIHCIYRLPTQRFPIVIGIVESKKAKKVSLIKMGKKDAIIRPILNY